MNTDLQKLNEITDYYNGLQKEAAVPLGAIASLGYAGIRLIPKILPKVLKFLPKGKAAVAAGKVAYQPPLKSRFLSWIANKGNAGNAFVRGVNNAKYANLTRTYASNAADRVLAGGKVGATNYVPKMNPFQLGANATWGEKAAFNAGRFINPNNYQLRNRLLLDYMAGDKIVDMVLGGGNAGMSQPTPQELAYLQGNPVYDNYGYGYGYDA